MHITKSVSIIIPNYNCRHLLQLHLPSTVEAIENTGVTYEIIIVDDFSTDNSVEFINAEYPQTILLVNSETKGVSYSYNKATAIARYELILFLNADIKLSPDYFEHQWKYFLRWETFGVMGRIMDPQGIQIREAARVPKFAGLKFKTDYQYYTQDDNDRLSTFYLSGANAFIDAKKLKQLGGFYELFSPIYCEDIDLSIRASLLKWKCYYDHKAICNRLGSESVNNYPASSDLHYRNYIYLQALYLNGLELVIWYIQITITDLLPKLITGQTERWKSYRSLFRNRKLIKLYKRKVEKLLKENDSRLTIFNVVLKIKNSVKHKKSIRIKR